LRVVAYRWRMLSIDGLPVTASNGIQLHPQARLADPSDASVVFTIASFNPLHGYRPEIGRLLLHALQQQGMALGAIDTGCFVLAEAQLLKGERVTLHWEAVPAFRERYPWVAVQGEARFTLSPRLMTSAGAMASVDLMLEVIRRDHGRDLALQVSEQLVSGWVRERAEHQRLQISVRYQVHNAKVVRVIEQMERHLEAPLSSAALAAPIGVTRRQLERLFQEHLALSPLQLYLRLRLERARHLLRQTSMGVIEVGLACGFGSASAFSRAYRRHYALAPSEDRKEKPQRP
jgi:AraC family transcriptional regulator, carnitine catabolism transcriptional activator